MGIAKQAVQLVANSSGFAAGLMPGRTAIKRMEGDLHSLKNSARVALGGMAGYLSIQAFKGAANAIYDISERMEILVKQSEKMGATVGQFRAIEFAAVQTGMQIGDIQTPLNMMMKNLSGIGEESKKSQRALIYLGTSADELRKVGPAGALVLIANGLEKYQDAFTKAGIISSLFGKQWQGIAPLLTMGSKALGDLTTEGNRLNIISDEDAKIVADYNDAIERLRYVVTGFKVRALALITPDLIKKVDEFSNKLLTVGPQFWDSIKSKFEVILELSQKMAENWQSIAKYAMTAYASFKGISIGAAIGSLAGPLGTLSGGVAGGIWGAVFGDIATQESAYKLRNAKSQSSSMVSSTSGSGDVSSVIANSANNISELVDETERLMTLADKLKDKLFTPFEEFQNTLRDMRALGNGAFGIPESQLAIGRSDAVKKYVDDVKKLADEHENATGKIAEVNRAIWNLRSALAFGSITSKDFSSGFKQAIGTVSAMLGEDIVTPLEKYYEKVQALDFLFKNGMVTSEKYAAVQNKWWDELQGGCERVSDAARDMWEALKPKDLTANVRGSRTRGGGSVSFPGLIGADMSGLLDGPNGPGAKYSGAWIPRIRDMSVMGSGNRWDVGLRNQYQNRAGYLADYASNNLIGIQASASAIEAMMVSPLDIMDRMSFADPASRTAPYYLNYGLEGEGIGEQGNSTIPFREMLDCLRQIVRHTDPRTGVQPGVAV